MSFPGTKLARYALVILCVLTFLYIILFNSKAGVGDSVPRYSLYTLGGETVSSSEFPAKPYILHFWAHWCDKCLDEMEALDFLQRRFEDSFFIVAVHEGMSDKDLRKIRKIIRKRPVGFNIYFDSGEVAERFGVEMVPVSLLVGKDGVIKARYNGPQIWTDSVFSGSVIKLLK